MKKERDALESRYRAIVQIAYLITLVVIVTIDAIFNRSFKEVQLSIVAAVSGMFIREKARNLKKK
jgi:hypothetical protein